VIPAVLQRCGDDGLRLLECELGHAQVSSFSMTG
jgi:hypothetical protein